MPRPQDVFGGPDRTFRLPNPPPPHRNNNQTRPLFSCPRPDSWLGATSEGVRERGVTIINKNAPRFPARLVAKHHHNHPEAALNVYPSCPNAVVAGRPGGAPPDRAATPSTPIISPSLPHSQNPHSQNPIAQSHNFYYYRVLAARSKAASPVQRNPHGRTEDHC